VVQTQAATVGAEGDRGAGRAVAQATVIGERAAKAAVPEDRAAKAAVPEDRAAKAAASEASPRPGPPIGELWEEPVAPPVRGKRVEEAVYDLEAQSDSSPNIDAHASTRPSSRSPLSPAVDACDRSSADQFDPIGAAMVPGMTALAEGS
jgi:hypothetical protein